MGKHDLTICSVSFHSRKYLELNWELTKYLNPFTELTWVIIENTPPESDDRVEARSNEFLVLGGYASDPSKKRPASYHHGVALNKALGLVKTRFVLILDPDFYIVRRNWIAEVIQYMQTQEIAFFGAPWHPKWYIKYRYFPCVHCMFIDLAQVSIDTLDFRPGQEDLGSEKNPPKGEQPARKAHILVSLKRWTPPLVRRAGCLGRRIVQNLRHRKIIGSSQDTAYRLYRQYGQNRQVRSECLAPVYRPDVERPAYKKWGLNRLLDRLFPDRLSYVPKRPGYYTRVGFRELGYADAAGDGWEEFMWKGSPFGFHIRGYIQGERDREKENTRLIRVIAGLTGMETA